MVKYLLKAKHLLKADNLNAHFIVPKFEVLYLWKKGMYCHTSNKICAE